MRLRSLAAAVVPLLGAIAPLACGAGTIDDAPTGASTTSAPTTTTTSSSTAAPVCTPCVTASDCATGACAQFGGDIYCASDCSAGRACPEGTVCTAVAAWNGEEVEVCAPTSGPCALDPDVDGTGAGGAGGAGGGTQTATGDTCGALVGPDVAACCTSCKPGGGEPCPANHCFGGWWCNTTSCLCQKPPAADACTGAGGSGQTTSTGGAGGGGAGGGGTGSGSTGNGGSITGVDDGKLDRLSFAVIGDTRPPGKNDTAAYPKAIIKKIWSRITAESPRLPFAVATGDYMFSAPDSPEGGKQLDLYLAARKPFPGPFFPALGNHECTTAVTSNCGKGNKDGVTKTYAAFMSKMLGPIGVKHPYYTVNVESTNGTWTAKLVVVAADAWNDAQKTWLEAELSKKTTYTFVIRHETVTSTSAPGVKPSAAIMAKHPLTMLIVGHTHTYVHHPKDKELIVGNGGAPLTSGVNYGYVSVRQRADGTIAFRSIAYDTGAVVDHFAVHPDGSPAKW
jgi:uncharacterized membrane protein YgcG